MGVATSDVLYNVSEMDFCIKKIAGTAANKVLGHFYCKQKVFQS